MNHPTRVRKAADSGAPSYLAELDTQLRRLRSWEDPADKSPTAVVYREMCAQADRGSA